MAATIGKAEPRDSVAARPAAVDSAKALEGAGQEVDARKSSTSATRSTFRCGHSRRVVCRTVDEGPASRGDESSGPAAEGHLAQAEFAAGCQNRGQHGQGRRHIKCLI